MQYYEDSDIFCRLRKNDKNLHAMTKPWAANNLQLLHFQPHILLQSCSDKDNLELAQTRQEIRRPRIETLEIK